jgi:hypothetical protein
VEVGPDYPDQQHPVVRAAEEHLVFQVVLQVLQQQARQTQAEVAGVLEGLAAVNKQEKLAVLVLLFFVIRIQEQFQTLVEG